MNPKLESWRVLFPIGLLYALVGTAFWPIHVFGQMEYPGLIHAGFMVSGFLMCFAAGFLMTAIPKFTATQPAQDWEILTVAAFAIVGPLLGFVMPLHRALHMTSFFGMIFLFVFYMRRRLTGNPHMPPFFDWVALGTGIGALGAAIFLAHGFGVVLPFDYSVASAMLNQSMIVALIVGVGARLVTMLMGRADRVMIAPGRPLPASEERKWAWGGGALFLLSFVLEFTGFYFLARALRAAVITGFCFYRWKLWEMPPARPGLSRFAGLSFWLWLSAWLMVLGLWAQAFWAGMVVHAFHLTVVGGAGLMVFMVATRVTLAHGGHDLGLEIKTKSIRWAAGLIIVASATRFWAPVSEKTYNHHLAYASMMWIIGVGIWAWVFLPKMWRPAGESSC